MGLFSGKDKGREEDVTEFGLEEDALLLDLLDRMCIKYPNDDALGKEVRELIGKVKVKLSMFRGTGFN
jgi:hypothetical protein